MRSYTGMMVPWQCGHFMFAARDVTAFKVTHGDRILVECPEALVIRFVLPTPVSY